MIDRGAYLQLANDLFYDEVGDDKLNVFWSVFVLNFVFLKHMHSYIGRF